MTFLDNFNTYAPIIMALIMVFLVVWLVKVTRAAGVAQGCAEKAIERTGEIRNSICNLGGRIWKLEAASKVKTKAPEVVWKWWDKRGRAYACKDFKTAQREFWEYANRLSTPEDTDYTQRIANCDLFIRNTVYVTERLRLVNLTNRAELMALRDKQVAVMMAAVQPIF